MSGAAKRLIPLFDRILIKKFEAVSKTKGGIVLPEKAQDKVLQGTVVAVGQGARLQDGSFAAPTIKVGDKVLLPEYGGTKVNVEDNAEYQIFRESDIIAKVE
ncbi:unnamed protein product [Diabrotica balteata]|uniref:10 kDa heat shock protein, mitochondrial n=2 Tax=Diabrotica TaxID=50385 RepID=A0A6P7H5F5_DIAVI|nr:10 kDa heat shock protein, mitochondrial-like [Diabrotica virgifera virgifera]CAG9833220.1 unnamed protein product [Diabrotica balteata]